MAHQEALAKSVDYQEANLLSKFHGDESNKNVKPKQLADVIEKRYNYQKDLYFADGGEKN